jgi:hypothetical protein
VGKKKEPLIVYWAPYGGEEVKTNRWNLLYDDPYNKQSDLIKNKSQFCNSKTSFFACPAFGNKLKNTYVFKSPIESSYDYDFSNIDNVLIQPKKPHKPYLNIYSPRVEALSDKPQIRLGLDYLFFCEESLTATFSAPYFDQAKYLKYGAIAPGTFDIGQWFRPYPVEITLWNKVGEFCIEEDEPIFYVEFLTDRPIIIKRFKPTEQVLTYAAACASAPSDIKNGIPLVERYKKFKNTRMNDLIMNEIRNNIL